MQMFEDVPFFRVQLRVRMDIFKVLLSKQAKRDLLKVPFYIARKLLAWVDDVENSGLKEVRRIPGYHDEPLKGNRVGLRSIRLSKAYRAIYELVMKEKLKLLMYLR